MVVPCHDEVRFLHRLEPRAVFRARGETERPVVEIQCQCDWPKDKPLPAAQTKYGAAPERVGGRRGR